MKSRWFAFRATALKSGDKETFSPPEVHLVHPSKVWPACESPGLARLDMPKPSGGRMLVCVRCLELSEVAP